MAERAVTRVEVPYSDARLFKWEGLTPGDTGEALVMPKLGDKTVMAVGTFNSATITLEGSLDPAGGAFVGLTDPQGNAISFTADGLEAVLENAYLYKPVITGGAGSDVDVWLLVR